MLNKKVYLSHGQFNNERRRVFDIANSLPPGGRGDVVLLANLEFHQCLWFINRLRRSGFEVTPEGKNDGQGKCLFRLNENGELVLHLVRAAVSTPPQQASAAQIAHIPARNAEAPNSSPKRALPGYDDKDENSPRQTQASKEKSRGQKNFQNAQRVSELLGQIRKQRYSSGGSGDWS